jgi:hypothetical protein
MSRRAVNIPSLREAVTGLVCRMVREGLERVFQIDFGMFVTLPWNCLWNLTSSGSTKGRGLLS